MQVVSSPSYGQVLVYKCKWECKCCTSASGRASASAGPCAGDQVQVLLQMVSFPSARASSGERVQVLNMVKVNLCKWVAKTSGGEKERVSYQQC